MEYIKPFSQLSKADIGTGGGKGASLGELAQAGFPIPSGFVIRADAFRQFLHANDLETKIAAQLAGVNLHDTATVTQASEAIRARIDTAPISSKLAATIRENFTQLGSTFVAVRSSATAEDSNAASWAGELESYLYSTETTLLSNIKRCWGSLYTPRAIFYRTEKGMVGTDVSVAVVIQTMVASEVSGICFTVHPVTENPNQLIIEAGWGLGEAIVGGLITPDSYIIDKTTWEIINTHIAEQSRMVVHNPAGGTHETDVLVARRKQRKLSNHRVLELARLAKKIEDHCARPQDIEWAWVDKKFWITQSRPITTLQK